MKSLSKIFSLLAFGGLMTLASCSSDEPTVEPPTASFTFVLDSSDPLIVAFTSTSEGATSYSWDFGDGNTSTDENPTHTYAAAGTFDVTLTASNEGGEATATESIAAGDQTASQLAGTWVMAPRANAFYVGPGSGSSEWFANGEGDVTTRDCYFDDVYTFGEDGSFSIAMGDQTWLETWQGVNQDECGAPVTPHDGSGTYTFSATSETITVSGAGAFLGLPKAVNGAELPNVGTPTERTYTILDFDPDSSPKTLKITIAIADPGYWTFELVSQQ